MRAIEMKTNGKYRVVELEKGIGALREAVGGEIEGVTFCGHTDLIMFLNEMGRFEELPVNCRATMIMLGIENSLELVYGDAVICGMDEEGNACDLTDEQTERLFLLLEAKICDY